MFCNGGKLFIALGFFGTTLAFRYPASFRRQLSFRAHSFYIEERQGKSAPHTRGRPVLVTGGQAGFIGQHLVAALVARGQPVACFRSPPPTPHPVGSSVCPKVRCSIRTGWGEALNGVETGLSSLPAFPACGCDTNAIFMPSIGRGHGGWSSRPPRKAGGICAIPCHWLEPNPISFFALSPSIDASTQDILLPVHAHAGSIYSIQDARGTARRCKGRGVRVSSGHRHSNPCPLGPHDHNFTSAGKRCFRHFSRSAPSTVS